MSAGHSHHTSDGCEVLLGFSGVSGSRLSFSLDSNVYSKPFSIRLKAVNWIILQTNR